PARSREQHRRRSGSGGSRPYPGQDRPPKSCPERARRMRSAWTATSFLRRRGPRRGHYRRSGRRPCRSGTDRSVLPAATPTLPRAKRASIEKSQPSAWQLTRRFAKAPLSLRLEAHGHAVDAVAQVCRRWSVLEYVAEMAAAAAAMHLGARHAVAAILGALHRAPDRIVAAPPAP